MNFVHFQVGDPICRRIKAYLIILQMDLYNKSAFANIYDIHLNHIYVKLPNFVKTMYCYMYLLLIYRCSIYSCMYICNIA